MKKPNVIGCFERVSFPDFQGVSRIAKIDTGAFTGAIHVSDITVDKSKHILKFNLFGKKKYHYEATVYKVTPARVANGESSRRYIVPFRIEIAGEIYEILLALSDRSEMKRRVLIGRRFLKNNHFIIDTNLHSEFDGEWKMKGAKDEDSYFVKW
ncbi:RimK/LysX family protein [Candidatus Saccharibacteria bacterium]|nr:RimK/LysX family protein [Candidatus Saccharibacteria bacterium]